MATSRLLRTSAALLAATALLISGCSSGSSSPDAEASPGPTTEAGAQRPAADATLAPLPSATPADLRPYYDQKLSWRSCGSGFACTTMKAPLDYADPGAGDIKLAVVRKKATGPGSRIGSLLVNPGGPGASAIDYLQQYAPQPAAVRARYDMVATDPRGVARSAPVKCLGNKQMDRYTQTDQTPDSPAEVNKLVNTYRTFAKDCQTRSGKVLSHVST
ncbi:alpha/beta hydrolase, partial [Streptomyces decoyicus]